MRTWNFAAAPATLQVLKEHKPGGTFLNWAAPRSPAIMGRWKVKASVTGVDRCFLGISIALFRPPRM
ncbi:MAG: hypothetical protein ACKV22_24400 [Bryobacteraceae bacterium]